MMLTPPSVSTSMVPVQIQSLGLPPERHADRVIAAMLRQIARASAHLMPTISEVVANSSDGSPKAQRKLEARLRRAGAFGTSLTTGKRGRYQIYFFSWGGWDPEKKSPIAFGDPMPSKPWLAVFANHLKSDGRGAGRVHLKAAPAVLVTHHSLSRLAQRAGARTAGDLIDAMHGFLAAASEIITSAAPDDAPPAAGWRVPVDLPTGEVIVVIKRELETGTLIATTTLEPRT
jgi:hypothetical protein